jgi:glycerol-3-phosphate acyltransferase PlsY
MENTLVLILSAAIAYLIGSISTAIITCRIMGIEDPRNTGSNNPGATNVLRHGGKKAAAITLLGDMLKGLLPVLLILQLPLLLPSVFQASDLAVALVGLFALLGHIFPVYYGFNGGKGVATFYGVVLGMNWLVGLIALAIWLVIAKLLKISSLSALISIFCTPFILWYFSQSTELTVAVLIMSILVFWRHKKNIISLLQGSEARIGKHDR